MKGPRVAINAVVSEAKRTHGHRTGTAGVLGSKWPIKRERCCRVVCFKLFKIFLQGDIFSLLGEYGIFIIRLFIFSTSLASHFGFLLT